MVNITLYMAQTANGMVARSNGETPWSDAEWKCFYQTAKQYSVLIMGSKTYRIMTKFQELENLNPQLILVLSRRKNVFPWNEKIVVVHSPREAVRTLTQKRY